MANPEHLAMLKQGEDNWNEWRAASRDVVPDLSGAGLSEANLSGANLREVHLWGADLREADLTGADLGRADLRGADLANARIAFTIFANVDLSEVKGLEAVGSGAV
jgi:uncharacterized protein YjbI with pentapeptide repeats